MRAKLKILVIDDEEAITKTIKRTLRIEGISCVETAGSYADAMEYIHKEQPQIVITDINLPDGNGLMILKETKSVSPLTQVIMMTGKSDQEKVISALELGASDFLRKPMDMVELKAIVNLAIDRVERWATLFEALIVEQYRK